MCIRDRSKNQLFWLTALPALSGATLRIFYSFLVPVFGGRKWTAISTASLLIPALGMGFALRDPTTSFPTLLILALLCGLGGGNFSSSMANISFFFPKDKKGLATGLNAGIGNLGVSLVQFVVPVVISMGVFGALGGEPQTVTAGDVQRSLWLQNAGFIWVIPIALASLAAWFGMNDIAAVSYTHLQYLGVPGLVFARHGLPQLQRGAVGAQRIDQRGGGRILLHG